MPLFQNNRFYKPGRGRLRRTGTAGWGPLLLAVAAGLLLVNRVEPGMVVPVQVLCAAALTPVAVAVSSTLTPAGQFLSEAVRWLMEPAGTDLSRPAGTAARENRIRELERENRELRSLTRFAQTSRQPLIAARIVMSSASPLAQSILIDAGREQGVKAGLPVVSGDGLIGRVTHAGAGTANVMLLSDRLSRVPVSIGEKQVRAILVGAGSGAPRLEFIAAGSTITAGDTVTTSGVGGVFPRGLAVGVVVPDGSGWRATLTAGQDDPLDAGVLMTEGATSDPHAAGAEAPERTQAPAVARRMSGPPGTTGASPTALLEAR